jgi:hypothetical protein
VDELLAGVEALTSNRLVPLNVGLRFVHFDPENTAKKSALLPCHTGLRGSTSTEILGGPGDHPDHPYSHLRGLVGAVKGRQRR